MSSASADDHRQEGSVVDAARCRVESVFDDAAIEAAMAYVRLGDESREDLLDALARCQVALAERVADRDDDGPTLAAETTEARFFRDAAGMDLSLALTEAGVSSGDLRLGAYVAHEHQFEASAGALDSQWGFVVARSDA